MTSEYDEPAGRQHYRFLEELSCSHSFSTLFDIGTHKGMSALALSMNSTNRVVSFDIEAKSGLPVKPNIEYYQDDLMTPEGREKWKSQLLASPVIFLDIDPHEGTREYDFYKWLEANAYKGQLVCDDIWYFKEMRDNFWYKIPSEHKTDVTYKGHWSGTGIVQFSSFPPKPANWTVVTAYFDLTRMSDATGSIRSRPGSYYFQNANTTMSLDQNLIVFCEPDMLSTLMTLRPSHLTGKTKFIPMAFDEFPLARYRDQIAENRKKYPSYDDRNTVSYYLFCMARYAMLKHVIEENPFKSTHFAWLNFCIERMGWRNAASLDRVFELNRNKVSTCYIDYAPKESLDSVVRNGQCTMCSGFFTGDANHMMTFCNRIESKFVHYLENGLGHADEQLYSPVFFDDPDLFEVYYGDYNEMITNYEWVRDNPSKPLYLLIRHSYEAGGYGVTLPACISLWRSFKKGYANLSEQEVTHLIWYYRKTLEAMRLPLELE